jgi:hypothetical protein
MALLSRNGLDDLRGRFKSCWGQEFSPCHPDRLWDLSSRYRGYSGWGVKLTTPPNNADIKILNCTTTLPYIMA